MDPIVLCRCIRCDLEWRQSERFQTCPNCRRWSKAGGLAVVAGAAVEVKEVVLHGSDAGLLDPKVRRGLASLNLGERCPHGFMTWMLCGKCNEGILTFQLHREIVRGIQN